MHDQLLYTIIFFRSKIAYCQRFSVHSREEVQQTCGEVVSAVKQHAPELIEGWNPSSSTPCWLYNWLWPNISTLTGTKQYYKLTILSVLPPTALVHQAGAVIGSVNKELVNVGSFVQLSASPGKVSDNVTVVSILAQTNLTPMCRWTLDSWLSVHSTWRDDPQVILFCAAAWAHGLVWYSSVQRIWLSSAHIMYPFHLLSHSVSVVHECSPSCVFRHIITTATVGRRWVQTRKLSFVHDFL